VDGGTADRRRPGAGRFAAPNRKVRDLLDSMLKSFDLRDACAVILLAYR